MKGLVEMHGGRVSAESDGLGKGRTFTVRLPALVTNLEPFSSTPANDVPPPTGKTDAAFWSWMTAGTRPLRWPRCCRSSAMNPSRHITASRLSNRRKSSDPRSSSWTSACPAERLRSDSANSRAALGTKHGHHRADRLGPGTRPYPIERSGLRRASRQACQPPGPGGDS